MLTITEICRKLRKSTVRAHEMLSTGGKWLGAARSWIQWNARNGDTVTWGTYDVLNLKQITVKDIEEFAAKIAAATLEEYKEYLVTEGEKAALKAYMNKENWASYVESYNGNLICFQPDRSNMHFAMSWRHEHGWDLAECVDGREKE